MKYSIIVPVFNEEKTIAEVIGAIKKVKYPAQREIIVVNDGSTDNTKKILNKMKGINLIHNSKNKGKGASLRRGFKLAKGEIILIQDADLEYNPSEHLRLLRVLLKKDVKIVFGSRFLKKNIEPRYKLFYFGNMFLSFLTRVLYKKNISDMETCYKAFYKNVLKDITLICNKFDIEPEMTCKFLKKGYDIYEVPISYKSRSYKEGKKISILDGVKAIYILLKIRFLE